MPLARLMPLIAADSSRSRSLADMMAELERRGDEAVVPECQACYATENVTLLIGGEALCIVCTDSLVKISIDAGRVGDGQTTFGTSALPQWMILESVSRVQEAETGKRDWFGAYESARVRALDLRML